MDKLVQPYDKEFMKMAMLKHEELFKEQVYELHRLYQIQKMLMKNMQRNRQHQEHCNSNNEPKIFNYQNHKPQRQQKNNFDLEKSAAKDECDHQVTETLIDENGGPEIEDECEIELTLGPTGQNRRRSRAKPESTTPAITSDSYSLQSFSSSSTSCSQIKRITRESSSYLSGRKNKTSSDSDDINTSLKQPPWMYQVLSLNMT